MDSKAQCIPTIYDVARLANVSISSVSRVINGSASVSESVRRRVQKSIQELDYRPNKAAQALAQRK